MVDHPVNGYVKENLGLNINSEAYEIVPVVSSDGKTLYFVRGEHTDNFGPQDIWYSEFNDSLQAWSKAIHMDTTLNNERSNGVISVSPDGNTVLLRGVYSDNYFDLLSGGVSISEKRNGRWQKPVKQSIRNYVNHASTSEQCLSADQMKLIMTIEGESSNGGKDLYVSFLQDDESWSEPLNLGGIVNSEYDEMSPFLAADGETLYFTSAGHSGYGGADIFVSSRIDESWTNWTIPKNLGSEINSTGFDAYYCITAKGDYAYLVSSVESYGETDIVRIKLNEVSKPNPVILVAGKVYNRKTKQPIDAKILYEDLTTGETDGMAFSTTEDGFKIVLTSGKNYGFRAEAEGFISLSENIDLMNIEKYDEKNVDLFLVPIEKEVTFKLNNLFFDLDKAELKKESFSELNRLVNILIEKKDLRIEVSGHTDNTGSAAHNQMLSDDRVKAVVSFLISKGITADRLESRGYGESKPIEPNDTEIGRKLNRRVEVKIL